MSVLSPAQLIALKQAAFSAVSCERTTKVSAELTVAQWALESGWGAHQPGNNCFGIKTYSGCFGVQRLKTIEVVKGVRVSMLKDFATFPELDACFARHAALFTTRKSYSSAWAQYLKTLDYKTLIRNIAPTYATDPGYAKNLLRIVAMPVVKNCLAESRRIAGVNPSGAPPSVPVSQT